MWKSVEESRSLDMAYKKSPYFEIVFPLIRDVFNEKESNLSKFIGRSLEVISDYLGIKSRYIYSSNIKKDTSLGGQGKIIEIAKNLGATNYINAVGGQDLYDKDTFKKEKINLSFLETELMEYKQFDSKFVPCLSIIDILMFNSVEEIKVMLDSYRLV